jgi:hypothetical protein
MKFALIALVLSSVAVMYPARPDDKCRLAPTNAQSVTEDFKGRAEGKIQGILSRLAGANASIDGEYRKLITDELKNYPEAEKLYVWQRIIYLACISPEVKIDLNRLFALYLRGPHRTDGLRNSSPRDRQAVRAGRAEISVHGDYNNTTNVSGGSGNTITNTITNK